MTKKKTQPNSSSMRGGYRENAGRKSSWNHRDTCTIRIPKPFAEQLVELARRLDNGEIIDTETESNLEHDSVTESTELGVAPLDSPTAQADKAASIDIETESKLPDDDSVTESIRAIALDTESVTNQLDKLINLDTETESKLSSNDTVTQSIFSSSDLLTQPGYQPEPEAKYDIETKSYLADNDNVTKSKLVSYHQTLTQSIPDLKEAIALALTIVKAKKSARESIARLLSKLYSTQVSPDDLK